MWGENELMAQEICLILTNSLTQILAFVSCLILESLVRFNMLERGLLG
ncbi:unnamed protein product [Brassica rapa subsp. narinosa]